MLPKKVREAGTVLGLLVPAEMGEIQKAFRRLAMDSHPDRGGNIGRFEEVKNAYELLCATPEAVRIGKNDAARIVKLSDGTPVKGLGRGFPITETATSCEECGGRGFVLQQIPVTSNCTACKGTGWLTVACRFCGGKGCAGCRNTGKFVPFKVYCRKRGVEPSPWEFCPPRLECVECKGTGKILNGRTEHRTFKCSRCHGVGEVKLFNPVLPRGQLRTRKKEQRGR